MRAGAIVRCVVALWLCSAAAAGQSDEVARRAARDLGAEGIELYDDGNFAAASERLERAYAVMPVPTLGLWSARALARTGALVAASERYLAVTRMTVAADDPEVQREAVVDARREYDAMQPRIPSLTITLATGEATGGVAIAIDGAELRAALLGVPIAVDPGRHEFVVTREGRKLRGSVTLVEGEHKSVALTFKQAEPPPPAAPATSPATKAVSPATQAAPRADAASSKGDGERPRIAAWVTLGVGAAGLVAGGVGAGLALDKKAYLDEFCQGSYCSTVFQDPVDEYNAYRTLSAVGFIVGGVGVAGGVTWLLLPRRVRSTGESALRPWVGGNTVGVVGRF